MRTPSARLQLRAFTGPVHTFRRPSLCTKKSSPSQFCRRHHAKKEMAHLAYKIWAGQCPGQTRPVPRTNGTRPWDKPRWCLGQTGRFLFNSTVNSPFCPVVLGTRGLPPCYDCPAIGVRKMFMCLQSESSGREPENGKFPKVVRRERKRSFKPRERRWGCTSAKRGCTDAKRVLNGAKDSWQTFAP